LKSFLTNSEPGINNDTNDDASDYVGASDGASNE
jgi:hypothetical protein